MVRMSAQERRESAVRAAVVEFAERGYEGTSTESIARRVGVSQPYLFRLFKNKRELFLAAACHCVDQTRQVFERAAEGLDGDEAIGAMGSAYQQLLRERPEVLQMYLQIYSAAAAAKAGGDDEVAEVLRQKWAGLWDYILERHGGDVERTTTFMAYGMLINNLLALGFPPEHRVWETIEDDAWA